MTMNNMVFISYGYSMDSEMDQMIKAAGVSGYTKWREIAGEGENDPHLGTDVWPLKNNCIMIACDDTLKEKLKKGVLNLRGKFKDAGVRMFVLPLTEEI